MNLNPIFLILIILLLLGCDEIIEEPAPPVEYQSPAVVEEPRPPDESITKTTEETEKIPEIKKFNLSEIDTKSENNSLIEEITIRPVCRNGRNAGELYYRVRSVPTDVDFQVRTIEEDYKTVLRKPGIYESYIYFSICDDCEDEDFSLKKNNIYILRILFDHTKPYVKLEKSNEYLINTSINSTFLEKKCQSKIKLTSW